MGGKIAKDNNLFWASSFAFLAIIVIFIVEEIICYLIIKKRGELENYREYKSKRNKLCLYSPVLFHSKFVILQFKNRLMFRQNIKVSSGDVFIGRLRFLF